jgi:hypothetical protein
MTTKMATIQPTPVSFQEDPDTISPHRFTTPGDADNQPSSAADARGSESGVVDGLRIQMLNVWSEPNSANDAADVRVTPAG